MRVLLVAAAAMLCAAQASAQFPSEVAHPPDYKDPNTAMLFSAIVPGGGQLWVGDSKGPVLVGVGVGGLALSVFSPSTAGTYLGLGAYFGSILYGIMDASGAAEKHNATLKKVSNLPVRPLIETGADRTTRIGLSFSFRN